PPQVVSTSPAPGQELAAGTINVAFVVNQNLWAQTVNQNAIKVVRAGADGILGTADDVAVPINTASIQIQNLGPPAGAQVVKFSIPNVTTNDLYRITLVGTGSNPITDLAGNALNNGTDFNLDVAVFSPGVSHTFFVDASSTSAAPDGSLANPFKTIQAGIDRAGVGDTVQVFPGLYEEAITLKSLTRVV